MNYFVSIENTNYFRWQIELLIESFKMLDLQDNLIIAVAANDEPALKDYSRNFISHQSKFVHNNIGAERNCLNLNKIYAITSAIQNNLLKMPFMLIHPDMMIMKPYYHNHEENLIFDQNNMFETENVIAIKNKLFSQLAEGQQPPAWVSLGNCMSFNNIEKEFFLDVAQNMEYLHKTHPESKGKIENAAWMIALYKHHSKIKLRRDFLESPLFSNDINSCFLHYKHGLPPKFNKRFFPMKPPRYESYGGSPYEVLLNNNPTKLTAFAQKVVNSYLSSDDKKVEPEISKNTIVEKEKEPIVQASIEDDFLAPL